MKSDIQIIEEALQIIAVKTSADELPHHLEVKSSRLFAEQTLAAVQRIKDGDATNRNFRTVQNKKTGGSDV